MIAVKIPQKQPNPIERYGHTCVLYADRYLILFAGSNLNTVI